MEPSIEIAFFEMPPLPLVESAMRERAAELGRRFVALRAVRIVVDTESNRFLTGHDYIVTATLHLDDGVLVVGQHKRHPDLASAVECTFAAMTDRLERRAAARTATPPPGADARPRV